MKDFLYRNFKIIVLDSWFLTLDSIFSTFNYTNG